MHRDFYSLEDPSITIAIVGCGGFIGSHLLDAILSRTAWHVLGVDLNFSRIQKHIDNPHCRFRKEDIANASVILDVASQPLVVNLAAICTPSRYMKEASLVIESNFMHPAALASACEKSGAWLIHFSTSEVYGKTSAEALLLEEDITPLTLGSVRASRWSYACAKQLTERWIASLPELHWTVVRPFNFIGPQMDFMPGVDGDGIPRVLANFCSSLVRNESLALVNGGVARRCFTSVHDAVDFLFAVFANAAMANGQAFNVGNPHNEKTIAELAQMMRVTYARITGVDLANIPQPHLVSGVDYYGEGYEDSLRRIPSAEKAELLLGWKAKISLDDALLESLEWFCKHYK